MSATCVVVVERWHATSGGHKRQYSTVQYSMQYCTKQWVHRAAKSPKRTCPAATRKSSAGNMRQQRAHLTLRRKVDGLRSISLALRRPGAVMLMHCARSVDSAMSYPGRWNDGSGTPGLGAVAAPVLAV
eukprot:3889563-Pyramimonas_sp.AAC.1